MQYQRYFLIIIILLFFIPNASAWYDNNYSSKTEFNISGTGNAVLALNVSNSTGIDNATWKYCDGKCNANFSDLFFTYNDLNPVSFEIENTTGINATTALVWIRIDAGTESFPHQMYFEDSDAISASNGNTTWTIYDNFNGTTLNTSLWDVGGTGSASVASGNLTLIDKYYIRSKSQYSSGYKMRARVRMGADADDHAFVGWSASIAYDPTKMNVLKYDTEDGKFYCLGGHDSVGYKEYDFTTYVPYSVTAWEIFEYRRGGTADFCSFNNDSNSFSPNRYSTHNRWLFAQAWTSDLIIDWIKMGPYSLTGPTWGTYGQPVSGHVTYIPPVPVSLTNTNGTDWVNYTWSAGTGNVTDQYNICINLICTNSTLTYANVTVPPHMYYNITVKGINNSNNTMNDTAINSSYQRPNVAPVLGIIGNKKIYQDKSLNIQLSATDADNDNSSNWFRFEAERDSDYASVGWVTYCDPAREYSNMCIAYTDSVTTPLSFTFVGTSVKLIYERTSNRGIARVNIDDGTNTTLDLYNATPDYLNELQFSGLTNSQHTIKVYWTGTKNASSTDYKVMADAFDVNIYRFEAENYTNWSSAGWSANAIASNSNSGEVYNATASLTTPFSFVFNGTSFNLIHVDNINRGYLNFSIDGGANTSLDEYGASTVYQTKHAYSLGLTPGQHTALFYWTGLKNASSTDTKVDLDAIDVTMQGWYGTNATKGSLNTTTGAFSWTPTIADVGNYTWTFNYSDGWGGVDSETINISVKANRLINVTLYSVGPQSMLVNDTQTFLSLDTLLSPTYLAWWNGSSQAWHKYKSGWLYRQDEEVSTDNAVLVWVPVDVTKSLNISHAFNYTLHTGQNFIGFPENITMSAINSSINVDGNCTNADEINYNYPANLTLVTYSCVSGAPQANASVTVLEGRGAWVNAVQNVTILDALG